MFSIPRNLPMPRMSGHQPPTLCSPPDDDFDDSERESGDDENYEVDSDTKHVKAILQTSMQQKTKTRQKYHRNAGGHRGNFQNESWIHQTQNYRQSSINTNYLQNNNSSSLPSSSQPIILQSNNTTSSTSTYRKVLKQET